MELNRALEIFEYNRVRIAWDRPINDTEDLYNAMVCVENYIKEAIPIEWMKKFANERALNDGMDDYWHFWGEDLLQMIEQWEKENDRN